MSGERKVLDRRKTKLFGLSFSIPVPWLLTIIVIGLVQFGVFFQQFTSFGETLKEIKTFVRQQDQTLTVQVQRNLEQDRRLDYQDRRIDELEKRR